VDLEVHATAGQETGATLSRRRPALLYRAGDRRYFIAQETGATLSVRRPALLYRSGDRRYFIAQETGATLSRRRPALLYRSGDRRYFIGQETGATLSVRRPALQCCAWRVSEGCGGLERFHRAASRVCAARVRAAVSTSNCWAASCESRASMASLTPGMTTAE